MNTVTNYIHDVTKRWFGFGRGQIWGHIMVSRYEKGKGRRTGGGGVAALLELIKHCGLN